MSETREIRIKRLLYQSWYRGCKETDRIVGYFCKDNIHDMSDDELTELQQAMDEADADIYAWCTGSKAVPEELLNNEVLKRIIAYDVVDAIRRYA
jgi:antitoxin CptB